MGARALTQLLKTYYGCEIKHPQIFEVGKRYFKLQYADDEAAELWFCLLKEKLANDSD